MVPTVVFLKRKPDCTAPLVKGLGGPHSPSGEKFTILSLAHKVLSDHLQLLSSCCSPAHDSPTNPKSSSLPPLALCKCHSPCEECQCFLVHTANSLVRRGGPALGPPQPRLRSYCRDYGTVSRSIQSLVCLRAPRGQRPCLPLAIPSATPKDLTRDEYLGQIPETTQPLYCSNTTRVA